MNLSPRKEPFHLPLGRRGEMIAWQELVRRGYQILEKNYRCALGEIDIVAQKNKTLVFVEVKTRSQDDFYGIPEEAVHAAKQRKLLRLASYYLKAKKKTGTAVQFEVLAVVWKRNGEHEIRLIENAFEAGDDFWQA